MPPILLFFFATTAVLIAGSVLAMRWFPRSPLYALLALLVLVLLQVTVVQLVLGALGWLYPVVIMGGAIALSISLTFFGRRCQAVDIEIAEQQINPTGWAILLAVSLALTLALTTLLGELRQQIQHVHPLSWDVVSYHLPNVVDYLQTHSLWTLTGSYAYYPGGNELLNLWSMGPLRHEGGLGLTTLTLVLGTALTLGLILRSLLPKTDPWLLGFLALVTLWTCASVPPLQAMLFDLGRNDITIMFWQSLVLLLLLEWQRSHLAKAPTQFWSLALGLGSGMLIGIKPNGVFLVLGLWGLVAFKHPRSRLTTIWPTIWPAILIGGFWYARNLLTFGRVSPPNELAGAMDLSIAANLFNPALYRTINASLIWLIAATMLSVVTLLFVRSPRISPQISPQIKLLAAWLLISIVGLGLTPSGAGYFMGSGKAFLIQLRYGAAIVPFTLLLGFGWLDGRFPRQTWTTTAKPRSRIPLAIAATLIPLIATAQLATYQPPKSLPAYEGIFFPFGKQPSALYNWVQENLHDAQIFSVGPRPYGLYGPGWTNRVISHLGATHIPEIPAATTDIVISRDPFTRKFPDNLRQVAQEPGITLTYQDPLAIVLHRTPNRTMDPMPKN
jgi:hypothetical protein